MIFLVIIYCILGTFLRCLKIFFKSDRSFKIFYHKITRILPKLFFIASGIVKTTVKENIDPEARAFCFNHQSPIDIVAMMNAFQLSYVSMTSVQKLFFIKIAESYSDFVFVDRTKTQGVSQVLASAIDNNIFPVMVSPEGVISNGNATLKFRTDGFLTERKIQPICLKYHHYFCRRSIGDVNWLQESIYDFLFQFLSISFVTIEIICLDVMD
jgi:1-acyl-sn-glycerol-3-phosphate acyltransferase